MKRNDNVEYCLILLADTSFGVIAEDQINNELKTVLVTKSLPKGSNWKLYAGARSIALFPLETLPNIFALSYSVITDDIDVPIVSFVLVLDHQSMARILHYQLDGILSAYLRRINKFMALDEQQTDLLQRSIVSLRKPGQTSCISPSKHIQRGQILVACSYQSPSQWLGVEALVVQTATAISRGTNTFRTFSLQLEKDFRVLGIVRDVSDTSQFNRRRLDMAVFVFVLLTILCILIGVVLLVNWTEIIVMIAGLLR